MHMCVIIQYYIFVVGLIGALSSYHFSDTSFMQLLFGSGWLYLLTVSFDLTLSGLSQHRH